MKRNSLKKPVCYSGWRLVLFGLRFWFSLLRYALKPTKYPQFSLRRTVKNLLSPGKKIGLNKIVRFGNRYYLSVLKAPHWPSAAFDRYAGLGGLNVHQAGTPQKKTVDFVILGITRRCAYHCKHCYEAGNLSAQETVPVERWRQIVADLQRIGVGTIVFSGGEPLARFDDLVQLLESGDKALSDFHLHTTGFGLTAQRARWLREAGLDAAGIGLDDYDPERLNRFRGHPDAHEHAVKAVEYFRQAGVFPYLNLCLTKPLMRDRRLYTFYRQMEKLGVGAIQIYEPKPVGRYARMHPDELFSQADRTKTNRFFEDIQTNRKYKDFPKVTYVDYFERPERLGCQLAGMSHFYIDSVGQVKPCVFLSVSVGNILQEELPVIFNRMRRTFPHPIYGECPAVALRRRAGATRLPADLIEQEVSF